VPRRGGLAGSLGVFAREPWALALEGLRAVMAVDAGDGLPAVLRPPSPASSSEEEESSSSSQLSAISSSALALPLLLSLLAPLLGENACCSEGTAKVPSG
jgi:hypothetical protein